jgi:hypothetical protein
MCKVKAKVTPYDNVSELLEADIISKEQEMKPLLTIRQKMVEKSKRAQSLLTEKEKVLRAMQSCKATSANSLESEVFKILKGIGVKQSSYHGTSLNGKVH